MSKILQKVNPITKIIPENNITIAFHYNCLCERGTSVAIYDYANYNETILGNKSIILYDKKDTNNKKKIINKFNERFKVFGYDTWDQVDPILSSENVEIFYIIKYGTNDGKLSTRCKNVVHCVFNCNHPHGDVYATISDSVIGAGIHPIVPRIISLPSHNLNMRKQLMIPEEAVVFARYGGYEQFDIPFVQHTVRKVAIENPDIFFLFANTKNFCENLPNIIHIDTIIDTKDKVSFINTCDAMLWGRSDGETFGLSIAEFSIKNKPVIATKCGYLAHVKLLGAKGLWYKDSDSLERLILDFDEKSVLEQDWNSYKDYNPENVMNIFKKVFIDSNSTPDLSGHFKFIPGKDQICFDLYYKQATVAECMKIAMEDDKCVGFNTLGFFKSNIENLKPSPYFKSGDGIYVKKSKYQIK
jgi:hypothetical protein